jgi:hypothetical protein
LVLRQDLKECLSQVASRLVGKAPEEHML